MSVLQTDRTVAMNDFLNTHLSSNYEIQSLAGDASFRRYHRIYVGDETFLLMDVPPDKEPVDAFIHVAGVVEQTINVPKIIAKDENQGFLLLQDFGTTEFAHVIGGDDNDVWYTRAMQTLIDLQTTPCVDIPLYSADKLIMEMNLFTQWFLPYLNVKNNHILWHKLTQNIVDGVLSQPVVLVHRDYHSRNLMIDKASDRLGVIDFQDALMGAYTYDLVSLLRDAYVAFDKQWVNAKIAEFHTLKGIDVDIDTFTKQVNIMGVQRHLKILGIFVRLYQRDGKKRYLTNLPKVMRDLRDELIWLKQHDYHDFWGQFLGWLDDEVLYCFDKKLGSQD